MDVLISVFPIALLIVLMTRKRSVPSNHALPITAGILYVLQLVYFSADPTLLHAAVLDGLLAALTPIFIVWGAIFLFRTMETTGAMRILRSWLNGITSNPVGQVVLVGWSFSFLIEGASGFGTPAALAAPLLVGLGFQPLPAAALCLIMNTIPVSFGAVGMPTWFGLGTLGLSSEELRALGFKTALIHSGAALVVPLLALRLLFSWSQIRRNLLFIYLAVFASILPFLLLARFSVEFPSLGGGFAGLIATVFLARHGFGLKPDSDAQDTGPGTPEKTERVNTRALMRALFPLWASLLLLLVTRIEAIGLRGWLTSRSPAATVDLGTLGELRVSSGLVLQLEGIFGTNVNWSHALLYVPSILPFLVVSLATFLLFRTSGKEAWRTWSETAAQIRKPLGAFLGAMVLVKLLMIGGERSSATILGQALADLAGPIWPGVAAFLGALGSFFSGSNTVSNLTFGGIQDAIATSLNLNRTTILSLQNAGGAMGNMVCIHNIVAVCSVVGLQNQEGTILKKAFVPTLAYGAIAALYGVLLPH